MLIMFFFLVFFSDCSQLSQLIKKNISQNHDQTFINFDARI